MKGFYEKYREDVSVVLVNRNNKNYAFRAHFHSNMELFIVGKGRYKVTCNDLPLNVTDGSIVLFDSYDVHGYEVGGSNGTDGELDVCVLLIPYRLLSRFNARRGHKGIVQPLVKDQTLCDQILAIVDEYVSGKDRESAELATELILSLLYGRLTFSEREKKGETELMRKILTFVQENYRGDASLSDVSRALGYTEEHVSRVFHRFSGEGLPQYVNRLRMEYVSRARANGDKRKMTELVFEAGFKSLQTYYRHAKQGGRALTNGKNDRKKGDEDGDGR
ncbi:MAG: helix-turn-helix transcriptional regulator [Clostridia bacterium]|nr:helix-turn-helix transcriptional regulator [Clostridia bacterium]